MAVECTVNPGGFRGEVACRLGDCGGLAWRLAAAWLAGCASIAPAPREVVAELAPTSTLRVAINYGNPILATRDADGAPRGVSVDLARELGRRLGVPLDLVTYTAAGKVVEGIAAGAWDVAFYAIDPVRAADTDFERALPDHRGRLPGAGRFAHPPQCGR